MSTQPLVLITGASSGIGEAFAQAYAQKSCDLVLVARRTERLETLARNLRQRCGIEVYPVTADLSTPQGIEKTLYEVGALGRPLDVLINNAGIGSYGPFSELPLERELQMIELNVKALVALTGHFLPKMIERGQGQIVQLGSTTAFQPVPYMAVYGASKAFVLSYTEALAREVAPTGVRMLAVCPGHTPTEFQKTSGVNRRPTRTAAQSAEQVVAEAIVELEQGTAHVLVTGLPNKLTSQVSRFMPRKTFTWLIEKAFRPRS